MVPSFVVAPGRGRAQFRRGKRHMWVSTRSQYGMRALVEVALGGDEPVSLKTVAERQDLSQQYLEQIFATLRKAGIVESVRGARGGYRLARPLHEIASLEVVELLEGGVAPVACLDDSQGCVRAGPCPPESLWPGAGGAGGRVLGSQPPLDPAVLEAMMPYLPEVHGNPSSLHASGRRARRGVEEARERVAAVMGVRPKQVVFTSGATEADNLALRGLLAGRRGVLVTSPL